MHIGKGVAKTKAAPHGNGESKTSETWKIKFLSFTNGRKAQHNATKIAREITRPHRTKTNPKARRR